jgi:hypothetical protein
MIESPFKEPLPPVPRLKPGSTSPCMEKLDRLPWATGVAFSSHGARIGIRTDDPALLDTLCKRLPPRARLAESPVVDYLYSFSTGATRSSLANGDKRVKRYTLAYLGTMRLARALSADESLDALESWLHFNVASVARRFLFVHSGVVGWKGRAILLPGRSMSGKSTLVSALLQQGATYLSDEYAVLDARGSVHPYAKPLSLRRADGQTLWQERHHPEEWGAKTQTRSLPVALIALTRYKEGARWRPRALSPGQAVLDLLDQTVLARVRPDFALPILSYVAESARSVTSRRPDATEIAASLLQLCERS